MVDTLSLRIARQNGPNQIHFFKRIRAVVDVVSGSCPEDFLNSATERVVLESGCAAGVRQRDLRQPVFKIPSVSRLPGGVGFGQGVAVGIVRIADVGA